MSFEKREHEGSRCEEKEDELPKGTANTGARTQSIQLYFMPASHSGDLFSS